MTPAQRWWMVAAVVVETSACTSILGDFQTGSLGDAGIGAQNSSTDGQVPDQSDSGSDAGSKLDASFELDANAPSDGRADAAPDVACPSGITACSAGCVNLTDASDNCGSCGFDCHGAACTASICGEYVIAQQPTTGTVSKLATDGTRVLWADTGKVAIEQIAATGGNPIAIAPASATAGPVGTELALAGTTVAFAYSGTLPSVGLAAVDEADSGVSVLPGGVLVSGISLNTAATHVFWVNRTGTQASLNDCAIAGRTADASACAGVGDTGLFLGQTAADSTYLLYDLTAGNTEMAGLYLDTIGLAGGWSIFTTDKAASLAVDGTWAYWTVLNEGGTTYAIRRTLESSPTTIAQTPVSSTPSSAFATDGTNVYYWTGSAIAAKPVSGGAVTSLATASAYTQIAVGGGLLVWTEGTTIWGLVLPAP
jgi:hypothetical protein